MKSIKPRLVFMTIYVIVIAIQSCDQSTKKQEQNKASIKSVNHELFNKGSLDFADQIFAADYAGRGPALIKEFTSDRRAAFPDLQV